MYQFVRERYIYLNFGFSIMSGVLLNDASKVSRNLSWNSPTKRYYSDIGRVVCPACNNDVNVRDLVERKGVISCKKCKR